MKRRADRSRNIIWIFFYNDHQTDWASACRTDKLREICSEGDRKCAKKWATIAEGKKEERMKALSINSFQQSLLSSYHSTILPYVELSERVTRFVHLKKRKELWSMGLASPQDFVGLFNLQSRLSQPYSCLLYTSSNVGTRWIRLSCASINYKKRMFWTSMASPGRYSCNFLNQSHLSSTIPFNNRRWFSAMFRYISIRKKTRKKLTQYIFFWILILRHQNEWPPTCKAG